MKSHPAAILACLLALIGAGCAIAGIYTLIGLGWALIGAAVLCLVLAVVLMRGLRA